MSRHDLQSWLITNSGFRAAFSRVLNASVAQQFAALSQSSVSSFEPDWPYLLFCASVLANSDRGDCQDIALRIAQSCISSQASALEKEAAAVVLDGLANRLAL